MKIYRVTSRNFVQLTTNVALSEESGMSSKFIEEEKSETAGPAPVPLYFESVIELWRVALSKVFFDYEYRNPLSQLLNRGFFL